MVRRSPGEIHLRQLRGPYRQVIYKLEVVAKPSLVGLTAHGAQIAAQQLLPQQRRQNGLVAVHTVKGVVVPAPAGHADGDVAGHLPQ